MVTRNPIQDNKRQRPESSNKPSLNSEICGNVFEGPKNGVGPVDDGNQNKINHKIIIEWAAKASSPHLSPQDAQDQL